MGFRSGMGVIEKTKLSRLYRELNPGPSSHYTNHISAPLHISSSVNNFHLRHLVNPLNDELNPICHLLALLGAHHILHVSRVRVTY